MIDTINTAVQNRPEPGRNLDATRLADLLIGLQFSDTSNDPRRKTNATNLIKWGVSSTKTRAVNRRKAAVKTRAQAEKTQKR